MALLFVKSIEGICNIAVYLISSSKNLGKETLNSLSPGCLTYANSLHNIDKELPVSILKINKPFSLNIFR